MSRSFPLHIPAAPRLQRLPLRIPDLKQLIVVADARKSHRRRTHLALRGQKILFVVIASELAHGAQGADEPVRVRLSPCCYNRVVGLERSLISCGAPCQVAPRAVCVGFGVDDGLLGEGNDARVCAAVVDARAAHAAIEAGPRGSKQVGAALDTQVPQEISLEPARAPADEQRLRDGVLGLGARGNGLAFLREERLLVLFVTCTRGFAWVDNTGDDGIH